MPHTIHTGDALATLQALPDNTFDAMLTDPPYGIAFMGKKWDTFKAGDIAMRRNPQMDAVNTGNAKQGGRQRAGPDYQKRQARDARAYQEWITAWAAEALRVLKPGAYALVACGTRTQHRMASGLEDAGFEVRDVIAYLYGSGFPKSKAVGCRCRRMEPDAEPNATPEHDVPRLPRDDVPEAEGVTRGPRPLLQPSVPEQGASVHGAARTEPEPGRAEQPGVEGRHHLQAQQGQLHRTEVRTVPGGVSADGPSGRVRDGTPARDGAVARAMFAAVGGRASQEPRDSGQPPVEPGTVREQRRAQADRSREETCPDCGGLTAWAGYGTALKPGMELWTLVRKPPEGTVAANCLRHGVGGLNIDGTRVGTRENDESGWSKTGSKASENRAMSGANYDREPKSEAGTGRWPANVVHDGSDEVLNLFPHTTSGQPTGTRNAATGFSTGITPGAHALTGFGDSGSAARFFYTAKASRREREAGLDAAFSDEPRYKKGGVGGTGGKRSVEAALNTPHTRNPHPTVKPLALTEYLARLLLPPERSTPRRILTPFSGVGSEMIGALRAGWDHATGIELDPEYATIAHARIKHWVGADLKEPEAPPPPTEAAPLFASTD